MRVRQQLTTNKKRNKQDDSRQKTIWHTDTNNEQLDKGRPRMTRGGQAARREGKQPLNPASSRRGRQATSGSGKQSDSHASSLKNPGKQLKGQASSLKNPGKQPKGQASSPKKIQQAAGGTGKQPEKSG